MLSNKKPRTIAATIEELWDMFAAVDETLALMEQALEEQDSRIRRLEEEVDVHERAELRRRA